MCLQTSMERYVANCVHYVDRFSSGGVVVWAGMPHGGGTVLGQVAGALTGIRYRDEILQHHVIRMWTSMDKRPDISLAWLFDRFKPNWTSVGWTDQRVRRKYPPLQTLPWRLIALQHEWQTVHNVRCNVWLLSCFAVVMLSSRLVVVITNVDMLATPVSHTWLCTRSRDTVPDMCIVNPSHGCSGHVHSKPLPWPLRLVLLVSCLPVLLLNQCQVFCLIFVVVGGFFGGFCSFLEGFFKSMYIFICRDMIEFYHFIKLSGTKEMFYVTTHSTHFIYGYMASDIW